MKNIISFLLISLLLFGCSSSIYDKMEDKALVEGGQIVQVDMHSHDKSNPYKALQTFVVKDGGHKEGMAYKYEYIILLNGNVRMSYAMQTDIAFSVNERLRILFLPYEEYNPRTFNAQMEVEGKRVYVLIKN